MSYGLKYYAIARGMSQDEWRVELLKKDFTGDSTEIILMGDGIRIGYDRDEDRFTPILSRYAEINLKASIYFTLNDLQFEDERQYQVIIYKDNLVEFIGWLIPLYSSEEFEDISAIVIKVMAKDTIKQLSKIDFYNQYPERANNLQSFKEVISLALKNLGYTLYLEIYYNKYDSGMYKEVTDCPLSQSYFDITAFKEEDGKWKNLYECIELLLTQHDLRLFQTQGKWVVVSVIELLDGTVTGRRFEPNDGFYISTVTLSSDKVIHTGGATVRKNAIIRKDAPYQQFTGTFEYGLLANLIPNGDFLRWTDLEPDSWTKGGDWSEGEITDIIGGGIMIDRTYIRKIDTTGSTEISPDPNFFKDQYLVSEQINISSYDVFRFKADLYGDDDIDELRIMLRMTDTSSGGKVYYVDSSGNVFRVTTSIFVQKGTTDKAVSIDVQWDNTNPSFDYGVRNASILEVLIYPGVRYRAGTPSNLKVKFRNLELTGIPYASDANYKGRKYEYTNTNLPYSKKADVSKFFFQDNVIPSLANTKLRNWIYVGDSEIRTSAWKRTSESTAHSIIESVLIDRLAITSKFGDIFEGTIQGYIDLISTPFLYSGNKRFMVLYVEYNLQQGTSEVLLTELYSREISVSYKLFDIFKDRELEVSDGTSTSKIGAGEKFDPPVTTKGGGTTYGGLFPDGGIDSLPEDSDDPKATNKGKLLFGSVFAKLLQLGNADSLTKILGKFGIVKNSFLGEMVLPSLTQNRSYTFPDRDIEVNNWDYLVGVPDTFPVDTSFFLTQDTITGVKNGVNTVFTTTEDFVLGSTRVYVNGVRQFRGVTEDYQEVSSNAIEIFVPPESDSRIIVDYIKATS